MRVGREGWMLGVYLEEFLLGRRDVYDEGGSADAHQGASTVLV